MTVTRLGPPAPQGREIADECYRILSNGPASIAYLQEHFADRFSPPPSGSWRDRRGQALLITNMMRDERLERISPGLYGVAA